MTAVWSDPDSVDGTRGAKTLMTRRKASFTSPMGSVLSPQPAAQHVVVC
jgi:hypothetical protein